MHLLTPPLPCSLAPSGVARLSSPGLVPNFAGEPAREAFGNFRCKTLVDKGISSFNLDQCNKLPSGTQPIPSGLDGGLRYQMSIREQFRKRRQHTYGLVRSSGALPTPYLFVLYSNLHNLRD
jgi:alpha-D-xyloside xylohydrolase